MTVQLEIKAWFEAVKTAAKAGAAASYAALGTALAFPAQALIITSTFDKSVLLSLDGSTDMILIPPASYLSINISGNKQGTAKLAIPKGTQIYCKQGPDGQPTTGNIGVSILYAR